MKVDPKEVLERTPPPVLDVRFEAVSRLEHQIQGSNPEPIRLACE